MSCWSAGGRMCLGRGRFCCRELMENGLREGRAVGCAADSELGCTAHRNRGPRMAMMCSRASVLSADATRAGARGHAERPALEKRLRSVAGRQDGEGVSGARSSKNKGSPAGLSSESPGRSTAWGAGFRPWSCCWQSPSQSKCSPPLPHCSHLTTVHGDFARLVHRLVGHAAHHGQQGRENQWNRTRNPQANVTMPPTLDFTAFAAAAQEAGAIPAERGAGRLASDP